MGISEFVRALRTSYYRARERLYEGFHGQNFRQIALSFFNKIKNELTSLKHKVQNLNQTNYDLGMHHYNAGNLSDAILRFKLLQKFYKFPDEINYYIGRCYIERNQLDKAKPYIESYLKSSNNNFQSEAKYCYDLSYKRYQNIKGIPTNIVERTFDILAPKYNQIFLSKSNPPQDDVYKAISAYVSEVGSPYGNRILDLGCGTGYIVSMLRHNKIAGSVHGVDISSKMLGICKNLKIDNIPCYDTLTKEDLKTYLPKPQKDSFDIIIASKILSYFNHPDMLFSACKDMLKPKGLLVLSFKTSDSGQQMQFDEFFEEFQFDKEYISRQATDSGLSVKTYSDVSFPDGDQGIIMLLIK